MMVATARSRRGPGRDGRAQSDHLERAEAPRRRSVAPPPGAVPRTLSFLSRGCEAHRAEVGELVVSHDARLVDATRCTSKRCSIGSTCWVSTKAFKVVVDSVNGAGCVTWRRTLASSVADSSTLMQTRRPVRRTSRSRPRRIYRACGRGHRLKAAVGFAQDPDADRLAIVDENGTCTSARSTRSRCVRSTVLVEEEG